ncbi:DUF4215 domain-containing protein [Archangium violaceum]|uniref:DUF4215 domain-containing protein n=1 Tax=Archangium violaceum TaxID=83451 RepID=UPI001950F295|nr:DUF4215 domain-containing protein [Archangium violaceum]QRN98385.1 DUF4215 domain-containing protein [Archangium violaceum]
MRRETHPPVLRAPLLPFALALLVLPLAACLQPESVDCPSGLVCPAGQKCAAKEDKCIKNDCGDNVIQASEVCDDGNTKSGDGCSSDCLSDETCGNRIVDMVAGEKCDDGDNDSGDQCSSDCKSNEACGNGIVDYSVGEVCDDGNTKSVDGCNADCLSNETCGNGIVDREAGEVCDDGNTQSGDDCNHDCRSGKECGNGIREIDEQCDDGNTSDEDDCLTTCVLATCGDGKVDSKAPRTEQCDTGGPSKTCDYDCTKPECGDGIVNTSAGELCDDRNTEDTDGCTSTCQPARCGDGYVQSNVEDCDPGAHPGCNYNCKWNWCGDGIVNVSTKELCDDGNNVDCGTCSADCKNRQDASYATGKIIAVPTDNISDGATFSINDGVLDRLHFEFDVTNDGVAKNNIKVDISDKKHPNEVADQIAAAISNGTPNGFRVYVFSINWNEVQLSHRSMGTAGNHQIRKSGNNNNLRVEGMSGGSGYNCPRYTGCVRDEDCTFDLKCDIPLGSAKGTCQPK